MLASSRNGGYRMRIFLIGASSPLGTSLALQLWGRGHKVTSVSRSPPAMPEGETVDWRSMDLSSSGALAALGLSRGDTLVSAAPLVPFARACRFAPLPDVRIVAVSSASAQTKARSPFPADAAWSAAMRDAENSLLSTFGTAARILRPTMIYGSGRDRNVARIASFLRRFRALPLVGGGRGLRAPVHVDDLAKVIVQVLEDASDVAPVMHVPGGEVLSYREMAARIAAACQVPFVPLPLPAVPILAIRAASKFSRSAAHVLAAAARTAEDLVVADDAESLGVERRAFRPDRRAVGLSESAAA